MDQFIRRRRNNESVGLRPGTDRVGPTSRNRHPGESAMPRPNRHIRRLGRHDHRRRVVPRAAKQPPPSRIDGSRSSLTLHRAERDGANLPALGKQSIRPSPLGAEDLRAPVGFGRRFDETNQRRVELSANR